MVKNLHNSPVPFAAFAAGSFNGGAKAQSWSSWTGNFFNSDSVRCEIRLLIMVAGSTLSLHQYPIIKTVS
jgi:hypothetical protein